MLINVQWVAKKYADVSVCDVNTKIDIGLLDEREQQELANHLREIADELCPKEKEVKS